MDELVYIGPVRRIKPKKGEEYEKSSVLLYSARCIAGSLNADFSMRTRGYTRADPGAGRTANHSTSTHQHHGSRANGHHPP